MTSSMLWKVVSADIDVAEWAGWHAQPIFNNAYVILLINIKLLIFMLNNFFTTPIFLIFVVRIIEDSDNRHSDNQGSTVTTNQEYMKLRLRLGENP